MTETFTDKEIDRYSRQIMVHNIGGPGQQRLKEARVLIIGAGGLGTPASMYLAAAGVGTIAIMDGDTVDRSNLQRQVLFAEADIGNRKVDVLAAQLRHQNEHVTITAIPEMLTEANAVKTISDYDLIIDCCDTYETRHLMNAACYEAKKPMLSASLGQWGGFMALYDAHRDGFCFSCLFPKKPKDDASCAILGAVGPIPGVFGTMLAVEAIKEIVGAGKTLRGSVRSFDFLFSSITELKFKKDDSCPICSGKV